MLIDSETDRTKILLSVNGFAPLELLNNFSKVQQRS